MADDAGGAIAEHRALLDHVEQLLDLVDEAAGRLVRTFEAGGRVFTFGNGGSAADAQHLAAELVGRYTGDRRPLPATSLAVDPSAVTCIANDFSFEDVFARQVEALARAGDTVIGFTTSGRSANVVRGLAAARERGAATVLFGGGGRASGERARRRRARRALREQRPGPGAPPAAAPPRDGPGRGLGHGRGVSARMRPRRVHMVGNAHIDPVWLWQWPEGYQEVRATFQSAIDRLEEYPDFVFTCDSIVFFAWVEETDPELFERIRARIAEGRWQVVGGWWVEPDCNIPSGESLVRQALYGQRYLRDRFGITATTGANVDSFGHNATIPQLLRGSGMDSYVFLRPGPTSSTLPRAGLPLGVARRLPGARLPDPARVLRAARRDRRARRQALAQLPGDARRVDGVLRRRQPRRRPDEGEPRLDRAAERDAERLPRLELSSLRRFFDGVARDDGDCRCTPASSSTTASAATRRTRGSSAGTAARRTCSSAPRSGARSRTCSARSPTRATELDRGVEAPPLQPVPRHARRNVDRACVRRRARPARPRLVARLAARSTAPSSRSRAGSRSRRRRR